MPAVEQPTETGCASGQRNWIAVACAAHALLGQAQGFMQGCHGKAGPLKRLRAGARVAYYAPSQTMGGKDRLQSFVSLGVVERGEPYAVDMGAGFAPYRRDVRYVATIPAPIALLLDTLEFVRNRQRWGYPFRRGLLEVSRHDIDLIASAMQADGFTLISR